MRSKIESALSRQMSGTLSKESAVCLIGKAGVGKTSILEDIAKENSWTFATVNVANIQPGDLAVNAIPPTDSLEWEQSVCKVLVDHAFTKQLVIFDELNRSLPGVMTAIVNIIQRQNVYGVPVSCLFAAAMNVGDLYVNVQDLDPMEHGRFVFFEVVASIDGWFEYTDKHLDEYPDAKFVRQVMSFLAKRPDALQSSTDVINPRQWTKLLSWGREYVNEIITYADEGIGVALSNHLEIDLLPEFTQASRDNWVPRRMEKSYILGCAASNLWTETGRLLKLCSKDIIPDVLTQLSKQYSHVYESIGSNAELLRYLSPVLEAYRAAKLGGR